jgi:hypothetical protein
MDEALFRFRDLGFFPITRSSRPLGEGVEAMPKAAREKGRALKEKERELS